LGHQWFQTLDHAPDIGTRLFRVVDREAPDRLALDEVVPQGGAFASGSFREERITGSQLRNRLEEAAFLG